MSKYTIAQRYDLDKVDAVVQIAEDIISENKFIEMEKLFRRAKRELDINAKDLFLIINYLFKEKFFVEGSRLIKQELLKNPYRALIYNFIKKYPGINFSTIKRYAFSEFKLMSDSIKFVIKGSGQFVWHIEMLLKFNCIKKTTYKKYSLFLPYGMPDEEGIYYFLIRDEINRKIFKLLLDVTRIEQSKIPKLINEPKGSIYYRIKELAQKNLIYIEKNESNLEVRLNLMKDKIIKKILDDVEAKKRELEEKMKLIM